MWSNDNSWHNIMPFRHKKKKRSSRYVVVSSSSPSQYRADMSATMAEETSRARELANLAQGVAGTEEDEAPEIWSDYVCKTLNGLGNVQPHPGAIVESAPLALVEMPKWDYPLADSLQQQINDGSLSAMQLEGIMYACMRHSRRLPDGQRAGFVASDSAGVGKGRQIAGIILDNLVRGNSRHVWFSAGADLHLDATRDLREIGCTVPIIESIPKLSEYEKRHGTLKEAVIFSTYRGLAGRGSKALGLTRYDELVKWLVGGRITQAAKDAFEGCLIFDEAHKGKNYQGDDEKGQKASSGVAKAIVQLQKDLPNARVVYSSATGISGLENVGYLQRMGLWGHGTAFADSNEFIKIVGSRNTAALEMLSLSFKQQGCQVARNVGYKGAEFAEKKAELQLDDAVTYRLATELWRDVLEGIEDAKRICCSYGPLAPRPVEENKYKAVRSLYWAAHQRFFKQLCMSFKVPALIEEAIDALSKGNCVVIGLQTTGESALSKELDDLGNGGEGQDDYDNLLDEMIEDGEENNDDEMDAFDDEMGNNKKRKRGTKQSSKPLGRHGVRAVGGRSPKELISVCRSILSGFIHKHFPVHRAWSLLPGDPISVPYQPDKYDLILQLAHLCRVVPALDPLFFIKKIFQYVHVPGVGKAPAYDRAGRMTHAVVLRDRLLGRLDRLDLPAGALDDLIDKLGGPSCVAEMTGRKLRQVRLDNGIVALKGRFKELGGVRVKGKDNNKQWWADADAACSSLNVQERAAFMRGDKLVAIISDAASTGISLHADRTVANQRRRIHCTLELPWAADQAIQQLGRSHRTNQAQAPFFKLFSSGLGGENRFVAAISRRLKSLGALTQGDRRASVGAMSLMGDTDFESVHGKAALKAVVSTCTQRIVRGGVDWRRIVHESTEFLDLDAAEAIESGVIDLTQDSEDDEPVAPNHHHPRKSKNMHWCLPRAADQINSEAVFLDVLLEAMHFVGSPVFQWTRTRSYTGDDLDDDVVAGDGGRGKKRARRRLGYLEDEYTRAADKAFLETCKSFAGLFLRLDYAQGGDSQSNPARSVPKFLNRILGLPLGHQALVFNYFAACMAQDIKEAKEKGKFDRGLQSVQGRSLIMKEAAKVLYTDPVTGAKLKLHIVQRDRGCTFEEVIREIMYIAQTRVKSTTRRDDVAIPVRAKITNDMLTQLLKHFDDGKYGMFMYSKEKIIYRRRVLFGYLVDADKSTWKVLRPGTGVANVALMNGTDLTTKYSKVTDVSDIAKYWDEEYGDAAKNCIHGPNCKSAQACQIGRRVLDMGVLCGSVIPLWETLENLVKSHKVPLAEQRMNTVQITTTDTHQRLVGVQWPLVVLDDLKAALNRIEAVKQRDKFGIQISGLQVTGVPMRPYSGGAAWMDLPYHEQQAVATTYDQFKHAAFTRNQEQLAMLGFAIRSDGIVDEVRAGSSAASKGIKVGWKLVKVGYETMETSGGGSALPRFKISLMAQMIQTQAPELTFLRTKAEVAEENGGNGEDEDDSTGGMWLDKIPVNPVVPALLKKFVKKPQDIRAEVESNSRGKAVKQSVVADDDDEAVTISRASSRAPSRTESGAMTSLSSSSSSSLPVPPKKKQMVMEDVSTESENVMPSTTRKDGLPAKKAKMIVPSSSDGDDDVVVTSKKVKKMPTPVKLTATGRPMRKTTAQAKDYKKMSNMGSDDEFTEPSGDEEEEDVDGKSTSSGSSNEEEDEE